MYSKIILGVLLRPNEPRFQANTVHGAAGMAQTARLIPRNSTTEDERTKRLFDKNAQLPSV